MTRDDALLTPADLAAILRVEIQTVYAMNHKRTGPPVTRVGRLARYSRADVTAWLRKHRQAT